MENFKRDILNSSLIYENLENLSVDGVSLLYNNTLKTILNDHAPSITRKIKLKTSSPWYTDILRQAKREKPYYEDLWLKTLTENNKKLFNMKET